MWPSPQIHPCKKSGQGAPGCTGFPSTPGPQPPSTKFHGYSLQGLSIINSHPKSRRTRQRHSSEQRFWKEPRKLLTTLSSNCRGRKQEDTQRQPRPSAQSVTWPSSYTAAHIWSSPRATTSEIPLADHHTRPFPWLSSEPLRSLSDVTSPNRWMPRAGGRTSFWPTYLHPPLY